MPRITVEAFAVARERLGFSEMIVEVAAENVSELLEELRARNPGASDVINSSRIALNTEYAVGGDALKDGDVVSIIPPVSGGTESRAIVSTEIIDVEAVISRAAAPGIGAVVSFVGTVRDRNDGFVVRAIEYESKCDMAVKELERLLESATGRFGLIGAAIQHRIGVVRAGEASVVIVVSSAHRQEAFDSCQWLLNELKSVVPIWKHEIRVVAGRDERVWIGEGGG